MHRPLAESSDYLKAGFGLYFRKPKLRPIFRLASVSLGYGRLKKTLETWTGSRSAAAALAAVALAALAVVVRAAAAGAPAAGPQEDMFELYLLLLPSLLYLLNLLLWKQAPLQHAAVRTPLGAETAAKAVPAAASGVLLQQQQE